MRIMMALHNDFANAVQRMLLGTIYKQIHHICGEDARKDIAMVKNEMQKVAENVISKIVDIDDFKNLDESELKDLGKELSGLDIEAFADAMKEMEISGKDLINFSEQCVSLIKAICESEDKYAEGTRQTINTCANAIEKIAEHCDSDDTRLELADRIVNLAEMERHEEDEARKAHQETRDAIIEVVKPVIKLVAAWIGGQILIGLFSRNDDEKKSEG